MSSVLVTGGCFCGKTRYTLSLPPDFKPEPHTCECTQCRKATGSLVSPFLTLPEAFVRWDSPQATHQVFQSSAYARRSFCTACGSPLTYKNDRPGDVDVEILVGSLDHEFLVGDKARLDLVTPVRHLYCDHEIEAVTDGKRKEVARYKKDGDGPRVGD